jgi:hypothetical protein
MPSLVVFTVRVLFWLHSVLSQVTVVGVKLTVESGEVKVRSTSQVGASIGQIIGAFKVNWIACDEPSFRVIGLTLEFILAAKAVELSTPE